MLQRWKEFTIWQKSIVFLVLGIVILLLFNTGIGAPVASLQAFIFTPVVRQTNSWSASLQSFNQGLLNLGMLRKENVTLRSENERLVAENAKLKELEGENESLRDLVGLERELHLSLVPAEIIGKEPSNFIQVLTIDKGARNKIKKGQPVVTSMGQGTIGVLVGQIIEVTETTAKILVITDKDSVIPAKVQSSSTEGLVKGEGLGYSLVMEYIQQEDVFKEKDVVVTSGLGSEKGLLFPKGLYIGVVNKIEGDPSDVFQRATIRSLVNFNQLEMVAVLI
ncbi:MAG: rod shape-determining protein MreC [bacterium]